MVCFANKSRSREIIGCLPGFTHTGEVQTLLPGVAHDVEQIQKQGFAKISDDLDNALKGIGKPPIRFKDHFNDTEDADRKTIN